MPCSEYWRVNKNTWAVGAFTLFPMSGFCSRSEVIIPVEQIIGMSDSEIGECVRKLIPEAIRLADEEIADRKKEREERLRSMEAKVKPIRKRGFVYLMIDRRTGYHKIGWALKPKYREQTLQAEQPLIELLYSWLGTIDHEKELHIRFAEQRVRGEWFDLSLADIRTIEKYFEEKADSPDNPS